MNHNEMTSGKVDLGLVKLFC